MKKSIFVLAVAGAFMLSSCGNKETKTENAGTENATATPEAAKAEPEAPASIVGVWKLSDVDLGMTAPKGQEKTFEDLKKDMIAKTVYTFTADAITMESPMGKSAGTYKLEGDKLTTVINNKTDAVTVQSLSANELILVIEERGTKMVMTFKK